MRNFGEEKTFFETQFMIKQITIENFFSFGKAETIVLNADTNILSAAERIEKILSLPEVRNLSH